MRIGQIADTAAIWSNLGASSSPGASIENTVLSSSPDEYEESLQVSGGSTDATLYPSDPKILNSLNNTGIYPGFRNLALNNLISTPATSASASATTPESPASNSSSSSTPATSTANSEVSNDKNTPAASSSSGLASSNDASSAESSGNSTGSPASAPAASGS